MGIEGGGREKGSREKEGRGGRGGRREPRERGREWKEEVSRGRLGGWRAGVEGDWSGGKEGLSRVRLACQR